MKRSTILSAILACATGAVSAQTIEALQSSAKELADLDWPGTYMRLCIPGATAATRVAPTLNPANFPTTTLPTMPGMPPPKANWYAPPAKIGDNLYFLGTRNHSTYALVSSEGEIILLDGNFEYATVPEIHEGLTKLGLDINKVKYVVISHAHGDHDGGAHVSQAAMPNATLIYGEGDWPSVLARSGPHAIRFGPQNDGTDGRVITAGDVSVQIITMPGHTPGTLSFLFEFKDQGQPIRVAYVGGTAISFTNPNPAFYDQYIASSRKFGAAAAAYGATALMSNHTEFDLAYFKSNTALALRTVHGDSNARSNQYFTPGQGLQKPDSLRQYVPNPYYVGQRRVVNYFGVVELCARAAKLRATGAS